MTKKKCPECGKFMKVKGKGQSTIYYCKSCDSYYFTPIFATTNTTETDNIKFKSVKYDG